MVIRAYFLNQYAKYQIFVIWFGIAGFVLAVFGQAAVGAGPSDAPFDRPAFSVDEKASLVGHYSARHHGPHAPS